MGEAIPNQPSDDNRVAQAAETANLTEVPRTSIDLRTEAEKAEGSPWIENSGLVDVQLDNKFLRELLIANGMTPEQSSALKITFRAARFADVGVERDLIGGTTSQDGKTIEIFTTVPLNIHPTPEDPGFIRDRLSVYNCQLKTDACCHSSSRTRSRLSSQPWSRVTPLKYCVR